MKSAHPKPFDPVEEIAESGKKEAVLQLPDRFYNRGNPRVIWGALISA